MQDITKQDRQDHEKERNKKPMSDNDEDRCSTASRCERLRSRPQEGFQFECFNLKNATTFASLRRTT
ncbi:hypothetical protein PHLGIDRAFT_261252 [Phlebiopsis gigantea 11061_1 CR5-6]|uniref:Uncharacterized protein n=1 Tax=Phlebiopsis gigantea (strain 11061_1 CR5-6) TaxID=745531 RepID=A0A0C3S7N1_PHLG1|nr:hypothetical protein PHLGIDRAFT_261252 [Phlebiopsis gigantea 11061_1 CR5-6]